MAAPVEITFKAVCSLDTGHFMLINLNKKEDRK